jgi:hypothetical protein
MSEAVPNQALFRLYATLWLIGSVVFIVIALQNSDLPGLGVTIYLGIGVALWGANMALTGGRSPRGHALSHALLTAAFAPLWPLAIAALLAYLVLYAVKDLRRDRHERW